MVRGDGASGAPLRLTASRTGPVAVLRVEGEIDISNEARLRGRLLDLLEPRRVDPVRELVVDLSGLDFLDLSGVRALADAEARLRRQGGSLVLRAPSGRVRRLLGLLEDRVQLPVES